MADPRFLSAPPRETSDLLSWIRRAAIVLESLLENKHRATGSVTLTLSSLTTTLTDRRIGPNSVVHLSAEDVGAGGEVGVYIDTYGDQTCTIHHGSSTVTRTFRYSIQG